METARAKLFWNGRSQAVRLPRRFRFEGQEVRIWREGDRVVLAPVDAGRWSEGFWDIFGQFGDDFALGDRAQDQPRDLDWG